MVSWSFIIKSFSFAIIFVATVATVLTVGPYLETRFFPVLDKLVIDEVTEISPDMTAVRVHFNKRRNCDFLGITWYRGNRNGTTDGFYRVELVLLRDPNDTSSPNRPIGYQKAGPWQVAMPAKSIRTESFVDMYHSCNPFWTTRTEFYP